MSSKLFFLAVVFTKVGSLLCVVVIVVVVVDVGFLSLPIFSSPAVLVISCCLLFLLPNPQTKMDNRCTQ